MRELEKAFVSLLLVFCLLSLSIGSFAWLTQLPELRDNGLSASSLTQYFAGGDGSKSSPFILTNASHIYNLTWLQNKGYFTDTHTPEGNPMSYYFRIDSAVIDMNGKLSNGAVPPIGSQDNPFIGYFNGNGCTIKNLWVSSDSQDWAVQPQSYDEVDYSYGVGFFGYIARPENDTTSEIYAGNFHLKNVEVTVKAHTNLSVVGLVAGYVDASMSKIGVDNGILSIKGNGTAIQSDYSLVGQISSAMDWGNVTGSNAGGDLIIAPNGLKEGGQTVCGTAPLSPNGDITSSAKLPDGRYSARYCGTLTRGGINPQPKNFYGTETAFTFSTSGATIQSSAAVATTTLPNASTDKSLISFNNYAQINSPYRVETGNFYAIRASAPPSFTGINGWGDYPTNCIWFKPLNAGYCYIAFGIETKKADSYTSIYRFKRDANGALTGNVEEMVLTFDRNIGNGNVVLFNLNITDTSYDYCIGNRTGTTTNPAYFFFLKLAGTSTQGGDAEGGTGRVLDKIQFVELTNGLYPDFNAENFTPNKSELALTGTVSADAALRFCMAGGVIHYKTATGITADEKISGAISDPDPDYAYPNRGGS